MKVECVLEKIKNALSISERMTGKNLTLPVLGSILITATNKSLTLRATNLSIGSEITIPAKVEIDGIVAVRGDVLNAFFSALSGDVSVSFEQIETTLHIRTKNNITAIKTLPHDDFPTLPIVEGETLIVSAKKFTEGLKSVFYSATISDIKPEIGSVYIYPDEMNLVFVATDSFRLAEKKIKMKQQMEFDGILIPFKNTGEILRVFDTSPEDITITVNKNQASFYTPGVYITSRVVDAMFPDYKQIIPKESTTQATILKQDFLGALKVANVFSDKFNQITLNVYPKEKTLELSSKNVDVGENSTKVASALSGEDVSVNLNFKYITDSFQSITTDSLTLELSGSNKPVVIRPVGDPSFMYLVMPMNR